MIQLRRTAKTAKASDIALYIISTDFNTSVQNLLRSNLMLQRQFELHATADEKLLLGCAADTFVHTEINARVLSRTGQKTVAAEILAGLLQGKFSKEKRALRRGLREKTPILASLTAAA